MRQLLLALVLVLCAGIAAAAEVVARVDLSEQRMHVARNGKHLYTWPVSTARAGKVTPVGTFTPDFLSPNHRSTLYNGAPMPWSIFFHGNYAIHGTNQVQYLGRPASAGCIRLHPDHTRRLYEMVKAAGLANTRIVVTR